MNTWVFRSPAARRLLQRHLWGAGRIVGFTAARGTPAVRVPPPPVAGGRRGITKAAAPARGRGETGYARFPRRVPEALRAPRAFAPAPANRLSSRVPAPFTRIP